MSAGDVLRAVLPGSGIVRETPVLSSRTLSERVGGTVVLKAENLQRTGSFKLRGALSKLAALGEACAGGVVTGSAGNHAQAVAYAARARGVPCEVFMPEPAPIAKVEAARGSARTSRWSARRSTTRSRPHGRGRRRTTGWRSSIRSTTPT